MFEYMIFNEYYWNIDGYSWNFFKDNEYMRLKNFFIFILC